MCKKVERDQRPFKSSAVISRDPSCGKLHLSGAVDHRHGSFVVDSHARKHLKIAWLLVVLLVVQ